MENSPRVQVLYAGASTHNRQLANVLLQQSNIGVVFANTFRETIFLAAAENFHAFMVDGSFATEESMSLCRALRAGHPAKPIIFFGSVAKPSEIESAMTAGATAYLTRPDLGDLAKLLTESVYNAEIGETI